MKEYGIIAAMQEEMQEIKNIMQEIKEEKIYELTFIKGKINDKNIVLVEAGVGKVNAARVTQILIDIGYIKNEKDYRDEKIEEVKKEIQYENAQEALTKILEDKRICEVEDKLGYIEATKYYKSVLNQIIPQYLDRKIYKVDCYREQENQEREYLLCLYAEENATIRPYIFSNKLNRFVRTDLEQLNQWQEEGLVIGVGHKRDGRKKLKKYMKKQQRAKKEGVVQE